MSFCCDLKKYFLFAGTTLLFLISVFPTPTIAATFTRDLSLGSTGSDVSTLQTTLKDLGYFTYPTITNYFGSLTESAVKKFQSAYNIVSSGTAKTTGYGLVGPATRALLNNTTGGATTTTSVSSTSSINITKTLALGTKSPEVSELQQFLKDLGYFVYPTITDYFGPVTAEAVKAYQKAVGLEQTGLVGPLTRVLLNAQVTGAPGAGVTTTGTIQSAPGNGYTPGYGGGGGGGGNSSSATPTVDTTAPVLSAIAALLTSTTTVTVNWTTDEIANSMIVYGTSTAYSLSATSSALVTTHSLNVAGLTPNTTYHYAVVSADSLGNTATSTDQTFLTTDVTAPAVSITAPTALQVVGGSAVTLSATSTDNLGVVGVTFKVGGVVIGSEDTSSPYAVVWDSTATSSGAKSVVAVAWDAAGNSATSTAITFTVDNTAPVLSAIASSTSATVATITWTTDEASNSKVVYGLTTSYGSATTSAALLTSHSLGVMGLSVSTVYHFAVVSSDASGNTATSTDQTFTTTAAPDVTPPILSAIIASTTSATSATVTWTTNEAATSQVAYGLTTAYGTATSSSALLTSHSLGVTGLTAATTYHYAVVSSDASGNTATSTDGSFTTSAAADVTPPAISAVASSTSTTIATITWTTDEASNSKVVYGLTTSYGSATTSAALLTSHSLGITGLSAATTYHYLVVSTDASGNTATSTDQTFVTTAAPDVTAPTLSAITASTTSATSATVTWTTNEAATSQVVYGLTASYGTATSSVTLLTAHSLGLTGLSAATTYHYLVVSTDASGNTATSTDQTFVTTAASDVTAPTLSVIASSTSTTIATITWTTDEASNSKVVYGLTTSYGSATTSAALLTSHSLGITGLSAATTYHYLVVSTDASGNTATSTDQTFATIASGFPTAAFTAAGGFLRFEADNPNNQATAIAQTFTSSEVNTTADNIELSNLSFGAFTTFSSAKGTRGWFSTTGTLPAASNATLVPGTATSPGTYVYRVDDGAGHSIFYKAADDSEWASLPGAIQGEVVRPAQRYAQAVDKINFTDGGTGTHTFRTWPVTNTLANLGPTAYTAGALSNIDPNTWFEVETDENGNKAIYSEKLATDPTTGTYRGYGKTFNLGPSDLRLALKQEVGAKRYVWHLAIVEPYIEYERSYRKIAIASGSGVVDTTSDVINQAGSYFVTGNPVKFLVWPGSSLPGGVDGNTTYYVRNDSDVLSFYPTATDATNSTNKIDLTSTGGDFTVYASSRVGDGIRPRFTIEHLEPGNTQGGGGNVLTPRGNTESNILVATAFSTSGATAGEITTGRSYSDGTRVYVWLPSGTVGPTRVDTGTPLTTGDYWTTTVGGKLRLHTSLQSAMESVGVTTNVSGAIVYNATGSGEISLITDDGAINTTFDHEKTNSSTLPPFTLRTPANEVIVLSDGVDFNNPSASGIMAYQGVNTVYDEAIDQTGTKAKGLTADAIYGSPGTLLNSAASHVAWAGTMLAFVAFSGTTTPPTDQIQQVVDYYVNKYSLSLHAPSITSSPTVDSQPGVGDKQTAYMGAWTGDPAISYAFQWQYADDTSGTNLTNISGATTLKYIPTSDMVGKYLRIKVSATNRVTTTDAYSSWSTNAVQITGEAETDALVARMNTAPTTVGRACIETAITKMKQDGVWSKLDALYSFVVSPLQSIQEAMLNWVASNTATVSGTVTLTPKVGVTSDGSTGYIDTGINPSTASGKYTKDSASMGVRVTTNGSTSAKAMAIVASSSRAYILPRTTGGAINVLLNASSGTFSVTSVTDSRGFHAALRNSSSVIDVRLDKTARGSSFAQTSQVLSNGNMRFMNDGNALFYNQQLSYGFFGGGMSTTDANNLYDAMESYSACVAAL